MDLPNFDPEFSFVNVGSHEREQAYRGNVEAILKSEETLRKIEKKSLEGIRERINYLRLLNNLVKPLRQEMNEKHKNERVSVGLVVRSNFVYSRLSGAERTLAGDQYGNETSVFFTLIADMLNQKDIFSVAGVTMENAISALRRSYQGEPTLEDTQILIKMIKGIHDLEAAKAAKEEKETAEWKFEEYLRHKILLSEVPGCSTIYGQVELSLRTSPYWKLSDRYEYAGPGHYDAFCEAFEAAKFLPDSEIPNIRVLALYWLQMTAAFQAWFDEKPVKEEVRHMIDCALALQWKESLRYSWINTAFNLCVQADTVWLMATPCTVPFRPGTYRKINNGPREAFAKDTEIEVTPTGWLALAEIQKQHATPRTNETPKTAQPTTTPAIETPKAKPTAPLRLEWEIPQLPQGLRKVALALIDAGGKAGAYDLKMILKFDPSRIYHDYKAPRWTEWIAKYIGKEGRGVYFWSPLTKAAPLTKNKRVSKRNQKRNVKHSK